MQPHRLFTVRVRFTGGGPGFPGTLKSIEALQYLVSSVELHAHGSKWRVARGDQGISRVPQESASERGGQAQARDGHGHMHSDSAF